MRIKQFFNIVGFGYNFRFQGGEPDFKAAAKGILNDFQRGVLPYFVTPPGCEEETKQRENTVSCLLFWAYE